MSLTRTSRPASIYVSRMMSPQNDDEYRLELRFEDGDFEKLDIRMSAQQFAEMLTAKVTHVVVTGSTR